MTFRPRKRLKLGSELKHVYWRGLTDGLHDRKPLQHKLGGRKSGNKVNYSHPVVYEKYMQGYTYGQYLLNTIRGEEDE